MKNANLFYFLLATAACFIFSSINTFSEEKVDVLFLKNGSKIIGSITKFIPDSTVSIQTKDGSVFVYNASEVLKIEKAANNENLKKNYTEFGANFGTPAVFNIVLGFHSEKFGIRFSGMYLGSSYGIQASLPLKFYESKDVYHAIALALGFSHIETEETVLYYKYTRAREWTYFSLSYNLNLYGFFLEGGLSVGDGSYSNPQLMFQIGYVHRFNK
ncbi:MAG TPA: hypothetical protein PKY56_06375 [Candidatus Kapabacteria bacterium]|nr:hypothetical protein [Candidatus Kapabacteria bacterium]